MRRPTVRRPSTAVLIGVGVAAVSVVAATCAVTLFAGAQPDRASAARGAAAPGAASRGMAAGSSGAEWTAGTAADTPLTLPAPAVLGPGTGAAPSATAQPRTQDASAMPRLVVPDLIASVPGGVTAADIARIKRLGQVRSVLGISGARITVNGKPLTVLGASASTLRPWTPPATAASQAVWSDFAHGDLITTTAAARDLGLHGNTSYPAAAATRTDITFGAPALLGVTGVDAIVNQVTARRLGLVTNVAMLINAPAADMITLASQVRSALGRGSQVIRLVPVRAGTHLPVDTHAPAGKPDSYLTLYQESAAQYCPGLSWTVLAAIGQIESGNGANEGPSSAGALGPMQFLPSTWAVWGIDAFGETGPPNIMDPLDAVPSAARMLCADGAASGGQGLRQAIFDYNHATWYVDEVLTLAGEYASEYA